MKISRSDLTLYAVTPGYGSCDTVALDRAGREIGEAIRGGVSAVQLREKNISDDDYIALALRAMGCYRGGCRFP